MPDNRPVDPADETFLVDRVNTERGEIVLRRRGDDYEIISNGVFLMDTRNGESERLLVRLALEAAETPSEVLIGGLGVGFSLAEAVLNASAKKILVIEIESAVISWHRDHLGASGLDDPRVRVVRADLLAHLAEQTDEYDVICLDIDNGPEWTVTDDNRALYGDRGLARLRSRLRPGGVLAVWSAAEAPDFAARLTSVFGRVTTIPVPVPRGVPDVVYLARLETR